MHLGFFLSYQLSWALPSASQNPVQDEITETFAKYLKELKKALSEFRDSRESEHSKNIVEGLVLRYSDIYFTTLSNAGSRAMLRSIAEIGTVIIDEACQSTELSSLIPFIFNPQQVILVGNPSQLPAATFEDSNQIEKGYNRSMFERFKERGMKYCLLSEPYKMSILSRNPEELH